MDWEALRVIGMFLAFGTVGILGFNLGLRLVRGRRRSKDDTR